LGKLNRKGFCPKKKNRKDDWGGPKRWVKSGNWAIGVKHTGKEV